MDVRLGLSASISREETPSFLQKGSGRSLCLREPEKPSSPEGLQGHMWAGAQVLTSFRLQHSMCTCEQKLADPYKMGINLQNFILFVVLGICACSVGARH